MRRVVCLSMAVLFLATIITGIAEAHVHPGNSGHHVAVAIAFIRWIPKASYLLQL
ncbi:hypothetical protein C1O63_0703 [Dehalococcoides mccartyi]|nr:hypothetical protein C1O63_0703 [Dehalococcoides mccartyi]